MSESIKSLVQSKGFWKIQFLNALWLERYYFRACYKVIASMVLISFFFEGVALTSNQKHLFLELVFNLFFMMMGLMLIFKSIEFITKRTTDIKSFIVVVLRFSIFMMIFVQISGLEVETYDSMLQAFQQNNFDYLIDHYGRYICFACLYLVSYKFYYERLFVSAIDVNSFKGNHLSWNARDWLVCFVSPNYIRLEKEGRMEVQFCLDYSWIRVNHSHSLETIEQCGPEK
ncbi:hypothetical protein [Enterococcus sp. DIV0421]|uniref:hypothetical protein n=1 Tax=Enterococcus sp. DIV0421 TaxID=2774688 RepID=UPI003F68608F